MPNQDERIYAQPRPRNKSVISVVDEIREDYQPTNTFEMLGGMVLLIVGGLIAYKMYLNAKHESPTAKAEVARKVELVNEMSEFKDSINDRFSCVTADYAQLDKRTALNEKDIISYNGRLDRFEKFVERAMATNKSEILEAIRSLKP